MTSVQLKFGGNILLELSENIPSIFFALNELIKNAYDAFSPTVTIEINTDQKTITITDTGDGMDENDIQSLFHIGKSQKSYGQEIEKNGIKRIIQGSKGLGFLAAFKLGDQVTWTTCKNGIKSKFTQTLSNLLSEDDLSKEETPIVSEKSDEKGTKITIDLTDDKINTLLSKDNLGDESNIQKLAAAIIDKSFDITIKITNPKKSLSTSELKDFRDECEDRQLFYVHYESSENKIKFYNNGSLIKEVEYKLNNSEYSIKIELIIFKFKQGMSGKKNISPLYNNGSSIHPLIYINRSLFNNENLFDPGIMRSIKSSQSLPQMIGRVNLRCKSNDLKFTSNRTEFVENLLSIDIKDNLKRINEIIQQEGSELKGLNQDLGAAAPFQEDVITPFQEDKDTNSIKTASIVINKEKQLSWYIPSDQIDLKQYILHVINSSGKKIEKNKVQILVDEIEIQNGILPSVTEAAEKNVVFRYDDEKTGFVAQKITLSFKEKKSSIIGKSDKKSLFYILSRFKYKINIVTVADLINAMNFVYSLPNREELFPLIACSIRAVFEISANTAIDHIQCDSIDKSKLNENAKKDKILLKIAIIFLLFTKNNIMKTKLSQTTGVSYSSLQKMLIFNNFQDSLKIAHLGAHQSDQYLTPSNIESSAYACGLFAVICDALLHIIETTKLSRLQYKPNSKDLNELFS